MMGGYAKRALSTTDYAGISFTISALFVSYKTSIVCHHCCSFCVVHSPSLDYQHVPRARQCLLLPTATRIWKIGATEVAMRLGDTTDAHLISRHNNYITLGCDRDSVLSGDCWGESFSASL